MKRNNIEPSRSLRRNQTDAEKKLWAVLRDRQLVGVKFRRQFPIGRYILDFYSAEHKLGIEADGGHHYEDGVSQRDQARTKELAQRGIRIVRFSDVEILSNIEGVCETIIDAVKPPHLNPLPGGERKVKINPRGGERKVKINPRGGERKVK